MFIIGVALALQHFYKNIYHKVLPCPLYEANELYSQVLKEYYLTQIICQDRLLYLPTCFLVPMEVQYES